jgi:hypothetical protein
MLTHPPSPSDPADLALGTDTVPRCAVARTQPGEFNPSLPFLLVPLSPVSLSLKIEGMYRGRLWRCCQQPGPCQHNVGRVQRTADKDMNSSTRARGAVPDRARVLQQPRSCYHNGVRVHSPADEAANSSTRAPAGPVVLPGAECLRDAANGNLEACYDEVGASSRASLHAAVHQAHVFVQIFFSVVCAHGMFVEMTSC